MRKFLSYFATASLLASAFAGFSPAANAAENSLTLDFADGVSRFTAASRTTCAVADGVQTFTASITGLDQYALAYYDFSSVSENADEVVVEFDSQINSDTRYWISLYDADMRGTSASGSSSNTYNTTGLIYTMGLGNGNNIYQVMGVSLSDSAPALGAMIHTKVTISFTTGTMDYTVTTTSGTVLATSTGHAFSDTSADDCTGIEFYSWASGAVSYLDNFKVTASFSDSADLTDANITADKTAQWTYQEGDAAYDLDLWIHGYTDWEKAAYIGFTLPEVFSPTELTSAELVLTTVSAKLSDTAYVYPATYSAFDSGNKYGGTSTSPSTDAPEYTATAIATFATPTSTETGEFSIDITDYMQSLDSSAGNVAFRIGAETSSVNMAWVIGSCTNGYTAPVLKLGYGTGSGTTGTEVPAVTNGDFSDGTNGWTVTGSKMSVSGGALSVSSTSGESKIRQEITGVADGTYDLTATVTASIPSTTDAAYLFAKAKGHTMARTAIPLCTSEKIIVPGVTVDSGTLDIGLYANGTQTITLDNVALSESDSTRVQFLKGGEISKLTYLEEKGPLTYKDADGNSKDCLQIMAEEGFNLARIRLLNNPGDGHGDGDYYLPAGYMDEADCLDLAKRAKEKGMQIEFTFAYSDYWSDGATQMVPVDWTSGASSLSGSALAEYYANKIYDYTKEVLQALVDQGTEPEFVSIGNEMQYGMCFNKYASNNGLYNNSTYIAKLANAGAEAVRAICPNAKIILHTDNGGKVTARTQFIAALSSIDFDVIGVSFYPYYNSDVSIDTVVSEFTTLINKYNKDVIIMETGFNWNATRGDGWEGQLEDNGYYQSSYGESQQGQKAFLTELYAKLKKTLGGRCIGDMYWDPIMAYDNSTWNNSSGYNTGWAIRESDNCTEANVVSNSDLFDFNTKALPAFDAMKYNTDASDKVLISGTVTTTSTSSGNTGNTGGQGGGQGGSSSTTSTTNPIKNTSITVTINGEKYTTTTDAYGQYIIAVDYPYLEKFRITCSGYSDVYYEDAPQEGVLLDGIDFKTTGTASYTAPVYNDDLTIDGRYYNTDDPADKASVLKFSLVPNDGISKLTITDPERGTAVMSSYNNSWTESTVTGEGSVQFSIICEGDVTDVSGFTIEVE